MFKSVVKPYGQATVEKFKAFIAKHTDFDCSDIKLEGPLSRAGFIYLLHQIVFRKEPKVTAEDGRVIRRRKTNKIIHGLVENVFSKIEPEGEAFFSGEDEYDDGFRKQLLYTAKVSMNCVKNHDVLQTLYRKYMVTRGGGHEKFFTFESALTMLEKSDLDLYEFQEAFSHKDLLTQLFCLSMHLKPETTSL